MDPLEIENVRLRRMVADRDDFLAKKGLWQDFLDWRPNDERQAKKDKDSVDHFISGFRKIKNALHNLRVVLRR